MRQVVLPAKTKVKPEWVALTPTETEMTTKTYKAETMLQALQTVQAELGAAAIVVSMREIPLGPVWNPWQKKGVEVVASLPEPAPVSPSLAQNWERDGARTDVQAAPQAAIAPVLRPAANAAGVEFIEEMPEIEWEPVPVRNSANLPPPIKLRSISTAPSAAPVAVAAAAPQTAPKAPAEDKYLPPALKKIQAQLSQQGVESALIQNLLDVALETLSPTTLADAEACKKSITELMGAALRVQKGAGTFVASNVVCVVGASGSGKTSAAAKLALFFSQALHKNVTWVCADTIRTGAVAEARAYTDALGLALKLVYTPADLKDILANAQGADLFVVDTPGYNPCNESQMIELGALLAEMPKRCTYLTAPATTKEGDLFQSAAALGMFNLDGLILTKLDETHSFGSLYNFARRSQTPLGYFTTGKETARHLEVADPARLVAALFGRDWSR
jgi:flagellar biosynthesis protein FlhF